MSEEVPRYEAIVLGLGGHGSASLYHLSKQLGDKVLGIEQFGVAHDKGSSHGLSRIIRLAYHEHPSYVPLLKRAYTLWRELEGATGRGLLYETGGLDIAPPTATGYNGFKRALQCCREHGLEHEVLSAEEVNSRYPGYTLPPHFQALLQPQGGILASERCIAAHISAAQQQGAQVHLHERACGWWVDPRTQDVMVKTDKCKYRAGRLVITGGAWMTQLIPEFQGFLKVERQVVGWFKCQENHHFQQSLFPVFILLDDSQNGFYGFPAFDHKSMKIGKFGHRGEWSSPDTLDRNVYPEDEEVLRVAVQKYFQSANHEMVQAVPCMFSNTPDQHFIIDHHPRHKQVIVCSACSGHGFKFCSVVGEITADLALKGQTEHPIDLLRFNPARPGIAEVLQRMHGSASPKM
ncbi:hypothetical protein WJX74_010519 [Apatococcus lobatus]|uniref:FAD dependent oxidoreductase domain-containing protein n=1 Tax=Apatococcus lobatus TaxID=904363 RepID=A0AAW1RD72_9CHLO